MDLSLAIIGEKVIFCDLISSPLEPGNSEQPRLHLFLFF